VTQPRILLVEISSNRANTNR